MSVSRSVENICIRKWTVAGKQPPSPASKAENPQISHREPISSASSRIVQSGVSNSSCFLWQGIQGRKPKHLREHISYSVLWLWRIPWCVPVTAIWGMLAAFPCFPGDTSFGTISIPRHRRWGCNRTCFFPYPKLPSTSVELQHLSTCVDRQQLGGFLFLVASFSGSCYCQATSYRKESNSVLVFGIYSCS